MGGDGGGGAILLDEAEEGAAGDDDEDEGGVRPFAEKDRDERADDEDEDERARELAEQKPERRQRRLVGDRIRPVAREPPGSLRAGEPIRPGAEGRRDRGRRPAPVGLQCVAVGGGHLRRDLATRLAEDRPPPRPSPR